jgi:hypothetical protein
MRRLLYLLMGLIFLQLPTKFCGAQNWKGLNPPLNVFNNTIYALDITSSGNMFAAGDFVDGNNSRFVAYWNGEKWSELGTGSASLKANNTIVAVVSSGSNVYAAGGFVNDSGENYIAKWNGTSWSELRSATSSLHANGWIYSVIVDKVGNVYAAGGFTDSLGKHYVAKWNGASWSELGSGNNALNANDAIFAITSDNSGNIYAGGYFTNLAGKEYVAKWNGSTWSETGIGANSLNGNDFIACLTSDSAGNIYAGGDFRDTSGQYYVAKWNGSSWSQLGIGTNNLVINGSIQAIAVKNPNEIYAGSYDVEKWDGTSWTQVNNAQKPLFANGTINCLRLDANNKVFAGGKFTNKSGRQFVAEWDSTGWTEPGKTGDPFYSGGVNVILPDSIGNTYVSGSFIDNSGSYYIEYWNNKGWTQLNPKVSPGLYVNAEIEGMTMDRNGNVYLGGRFVDENGNHYIAKWNGKAWSKLEDFPNSLKATGDIIGLQADKYGNIYAAGTFNDTIVGLVSLAKWDGKTWTRLPGSAADYIEHFCVAGDGNIYAFGAFGGSTKYYVAKYNTIIEKWIQVKNPDSSGFTVPGANVFESLATDSKNNLYVNGNFTNKAGQRFIAKWDGKDWSEFGTTTSLNGNLLIDDSDNIYSSGRPAYGTDCVVKKWSGTSWAGLGTPLSQNDAAPEGRVLAVDRNGNIYSDGVLPDVPGTHTFITRFGTSGIPVPKIISFTPSAGSLGSKITITGKNFTGATSINFGGTPASSFTVKNDSTINAVVANGATGSVYVETSFGSDSLGKFTYSCDSINNLAPAISSIGDSILVSTTANYYQWYLNNTELENTNAASIKVPKTGFYRVETSPNSVCWSSSPDYPIIVSVSPLVDTLKMRIYPNPSSGQFTVDVKLPQTTSVITYVAIYDANGIQILQTNKLIFLGNEIKIPVTINTKGTFFVKVYVNGDSREQTVLIL